jgi:hypothetical protein
MQQKSLAPLVTDSQDIGNAGGGFFQKTLNSRDLQQAAAEDYSTDSL